MARRFSGSALRTLREKRGLTRAQLAGRITDASGIECSESAVAAWESEANRPMVDSAFAAAFVLGVRLDDISEIVEPVA